MHWLEIIRRAQRDVRSLTARTTTRAEWQSGLVIRWFRMEGFLTLNGCALSRPGDNRPISPSSSHRRGGLAPMSARCILGMVGLKAGAACPLKWHASRVQNVARCLNPHPMRAWVKFLGGSAQYERNAERSRWCTQLFPPEASLGSYEKGINAESI